MGYCSLRQMGPFPFGAFHRIKHSEQLHPTGFTFIAATSQTHLHIKKAKATRCLPPRKQVMSETHQVGWERLNIPEGNGRWGISVQEKILSRGLGDQAGTCSFKLTWFLNHQTTNCSPLAPYPFLHIPRSSFAALPQLASWFPTLLLR